MAQEFVSYTILRAGLSLSQYSDRCAQNRCSAVAPKQYKLNITPASWGHQGASGISHKPHTDTKLSLPFQGAGFPICILCTPACPMLIASFGVIPSPDACLSDERQRTGCARRSKAQPYIATASPPLPWDQSARHPLTTVFPRPLCMNGIGLPGITLSMLPCLSNGQRLLAPI